MAQILAELQTTKRTLTKEKVYDCCIVRGCDWCLVREAGCTCEPDLKKGELVCAECKYGWEAGLGEVGGVKLKDVRTSLKPVGEKKGKEKATW